MSFIINPFVFQVQNYLVDDYSPDYCWTVERVDLADSDLIRVRRSSDNAESDFNGTEIADGTLVSWVGVGNNGSVTTWYNVGTAGTLSLTQATATEQPKIVISGVLNTKNGKPSVLFDGSNDENSNTTQILDNVPFSVFGVASNEQGSTGSGLFFSNRDTTAEGMLMFVDRRTNKNGFLLNDGTVNNIYNYPSQLDNSNLRIQSFTIDASDNGELWLDGTSQETLTTANTYSLTSGKVIMLGGQALSSQRRKVNVSLVMLFSSDETSNQSSIESDLNTIYSTF
jgi:hypothetical protein